jgi:hypothetical protein
MLLPAGLLRAVNRYGLHSACEVRAKVLFCLLLFAALFLVYVPGKFSELIMNVLFSIDLMDNRDMDVEPEGMRELVGNEG